MKKFLAVILSAALTVSAAGCARTEKPYTPTGNALEGVEAPRVPAPTQEDQTARSLCIPYYSERSLNPYQCTDFTNRTLFSLLYQGLFSVSRDYQVEAVLCSYYTVSDDMKTYTFYINDRATFSDGTYLTEEDVAASLHAAWDSAYYKGRFLHVESIAVTVSGGIAVQLDTPYENLPLLLDIPIVKAGQINALRPLGTGPYEYASTASGTRLHRLPTWWSDADVPYTMDSVELLEAESPSQIRDQFEFYDVGLVCTDPCVDTYADYRCDYELWDCENGMFLYLGCNMETGIFTNNSIRSALTFAIDREELAKEFYRDFGKAITLPASPQSPWYDESLAKDYAYSPEKFQSALESAGLKDSEIVLLVNKDDSLRTRVAYAIADMLMEGGLKVKVSALSGVDYVDAYVSGWYDLHLGQTKLSPNMDLSPFFAPWGGLSYNHMEDPAIYSMCRDALENSGNYFTLYQMVMDDGRLCPLVSGGYAVYADRGLISGLAPSRDNIFYYSTGRTAEQVRQQTDVEDPTVPPEEIPEMTEP